MKSNIIAVILFPVIFILISIIFKIGEFYSFISYDQYECPIHVQIIISKNILLADDPALSVSHSNNPPTSSNNKIIICYIN